MSLNGSPGKPPNASDLPIETRHLGRQLHLLPRQLGVASGIVLGADLLRPREVLLVRILGLLRGHAYGRGGEADLARLDRDALYPHAERRRGDHVGHVPRVVVAAVDGVEVARKAVELAGTRHHVAVVHVALRSVDHHAVCAAHGRRLEHDTRQAWPVGGDRLAAHDVRMALEVDDADRRRALAVYAQHLHGLVRRRAGGAHDVRVASARIGAHLAVLHEVTTAEGDPLRL